MLNKTMEELNQKIRKQILVRNFINSKNTVKMEYFSTFFYIKVSIFELLNRTLKIKCGNYSSEIN